MPDRTLLKNESRSLQIKEFTMTEYAHFLDDEEKMKDFKILTKSEFLKSYSYLKEGDYDLTAELVNVK